MTHRTVRCAAAMLLLAACALAPGTARAQGSGYGEPVKTAPRDTSRFLPDWLHLHAAIGVGWLASPIQIRQIYQAGQGYELGLEARPADAWRLRLNAE